MSKKRSLEDIDDNIYYGGMLPDLNITSTLPSINTKEGKRIAKNIANNVYQGKISLNSVPRDYYNYVEGEVKGAIPTRQALNKIAKPIGLTAAGIMGTLGAGQILPGIAASYNKFAIKHPAITTGIDVLGYLDSARNAASKNGISKTIKEFKKSNYGKGSLSLLGDLFDATAIGGLFKKSAKIGHDLAKFSSFLKYEDLTPNMNWYTPQEINDYFELYTRAANNPQTNNIGRRLIPSRINDNLINETNQNVRDYVSHLSLEDISHGERNIQQSVQNNLINETNQVNVNPINNRTIIDDAENERRFEALQAQYEDPGSWIMEPTINESVNSKDIPNQISKKIHVNELNPLLKEYDRFSPDFYNSFKRYLTPEQINYLETNKYTNNISIVNNKLLDNGILLKLDKIDNKVKISLENINDFYDNKFGKDIKIPGAIRKEVLNGPLGDYFKKQIKDTKSENLLQIWANYGFQSGHGGIGGYKRDIIINDDYKDIAKLAGRELTKRYGINFNDFNNYDKITEFLRFGENSPYKGYQYTLPGDLNSMTWFHAKHAGNKGSRKAFESATELSSTLPRGTAITEHNTSPDSYLLELAFGLKNYGSNPTQKGKVGIQFLKDKNGNYIMGSGNNLQRDQLKLEDLIENYKGTDKEQFKEYLENVNDNLINEKYDNYVFEEMKKVRDRNLLRINKWLNEARLKTGIKDIPNAIIPTWNDNFRHWDVAHYKGSYSPTIRRPDFNLIKFNNGGRISLNSIR